MPRAFEAAFGNTPKVLARIREQLKARAARGLYVVDARRRSSTAASSLSLQTNQSPDGRLPPYYAVRIKLSDGEMTRLDGLDIVASMPAEVMMTARPRTVNSYLMKPMTDQFNRAFRDE